MDLANHSQAVGAGRFRPQLDGLGAAGLGHWAKNPGGALFGAQNDAPGTLKRRICSVLALGHFQVCLSLSLSLEMFPQELVLYFVAKIAHGLLL